MRILGFSKKWGKLGLSEFTTFRLPRKDADWFEEEVVQIVYKPRSKEREKLGIAKIIDKESRIISSITSLEAIADGFSEGRVEMWRWLLETHKGITLETPIDKLTLRWVK